jgi:hypothetical protein
MCELLGYTDEDTTNIPAQGRMDEQRHDNELGHDNDDDGAAIPTNDVIPDEMIISYNKNNPSMEVGTVYPTMEEFKLVVRQFVINEKFDLGIEKSCKTRYRAYCKPDDEYYPCPWRINGTKQKGQATVEVNNLFLFH